MKSLNLNRPVFLLQELAMLENLIEVKRCFSHRGRKAWQTRESDIRSLCFGTWSIISSIISWESRRIGGLSLCGEVAIQKC